MKKHSFRTKKHIFSYIFLTFICVLTLLPIVLTFLYSFFPPGEIKKYLDTRNQYEPEKWMRILISPTIVSLRQYYTILIERPVYLQLFVNSVLYTVSILIGQALIIPLTAYAMSRFKFPGRDALFFLVIMLMLLPFQVTMAPSVLTMRALGLMDSVWAVILPMFFSPFYLFLLRQFMVGLPDELLEAGMMDGAGPFRCFVHIVLPVCKPILGAAIALSFADSWNMVEQPLVYLAGQTARQPLSVMFNQLTQEGSDVAFAGAALYLLPALLIYAYFQHDILLGLQLSELK